MTQSRTRGSLGCLAGRRWLAAAAFLATLGGGAAVAAPPAGKAWVAGVASSFAGTALPEGWSPLERPASAWDSARLADNVLVGDGRLRLIARLVAQDGWHWTTALAAAGGLRQAAGYVEAEIRIAAAGGLGNRFALVGTAPGGGEIAIGFEAQFPETLVMTLRGVPLPVMQRVRTRGIDLSGGFHRYGIEFLPAGQGKVAIGWYLDELSVGTAECTACAVPLHPDLGTSVSVNAKAAGPATLALDGKSMDVAAVRCWRPKDLPDGRPGAGASGAPEDDSPSRGVAGRDAALASAGRAPLP